MKNKTLLDALVKNLLDEPSEMQVSQIFASELFNFLGLELNEYLPSFSTGSVTEAVDCDLPHHIFSETKTNPDVLVELKSGNVHLSC